jgi:D-glucosaminate-6-phosphate ammonia-lyase
MPDRRSFLKRLSTVPMLGGIFSGAAGAASPMTRDYFKELGIKPFINAAGTYTALTASLMPHEVMQAMDYASHKFVHLTEVQDAVGARIAKMTGAEAAMVTSGAAGALTSGTAGCITGKDAKAIQQLPDVTGLKSEVIIQKSHRCGYDHAVRTCGVKMIEIETADDFDHAASNKTAMALFFNGNEPLGKIKAEEWVALGKKHNVPTFNDAAADTPPTSVLSKFTNMGFDLVTFSGGKGIRGPQSAGLLLGRKDLIEAARLNTSPNSDTIGRGMKVNKEEMIGMLVALELFMKRDHDADWREWEHRIKIISDAIASVPTVKTETKVYEIANRVPHLLARWDQSRVKITPPDVLKQLRSGEPSIEGNPGTTQDELVIGVWMLQPGEAEVVGRRLREILKGA